MTVKAFENVPVLNTDDVKISCIEASGKYLYLGSDEGQIESYIIEERQKLQDETLFSSYKLRQGQIGIKKPIIQLKSSSALRRLMALCDGSLCTMNSDTLTVVGSSGAKVKNVCVFSLNENPNVLDPFSLEICIGKKRSLHLAVLSNDKITLLKEISVSDTPQALAMDGAYICCAGQLEYFIYNINDGTNLNLFPFGESVSPYIKRISKEEFLLAGPSNLGMFATVAGISKRPPINWTERIRGVDHYHPYIIVLSELYIHIYSLIDQKLKQTISFYGGKLLGNFDGQLYVASTNQVSCLNPVPFLTQIQNLLEEEKIEDALMLIESSKDLGVFTTQQYDSCYENTLQKAGFIKLFQGHFLEAQENFIKGKLNFKEIVALYPNLCSTNSSYIRVLPPLHHMADINQAYQGQLELLTKFKEFLISYLVRIRFSTNLEIDIKELDTVLIKLYSYTDPKRLIKFLEHNEVNCYFEECEKFLKDQNQYVGLSNLYCKKGDIQKAVKILCQLQEGAITDSLYSGGRTLLYYGSLPVLY